MEGEKEFPSIDALAVETIEGNSGASALPQRLGRYSEAHHRALSMAHYIKKRVSSKIFPDVGKLVQDLSTCGSYLVFHHYFNVDEMRLAGMTSCKKSLLCPLCAMRRGVKMLQAYMERLKVITAENPSVKPFLVTLTVKDGPGLEERFNHLQGSLKEYNQQRRNAIKGLRQNVEFNKALGSVGSFEFKRGKGSGLWHPHYHAVWLCEETPDEKQLASEWHSITGDSYIVNVTPFHDSDDVVTGFLEVFKYAIKFSDLPFADNWEGFLYLNGRRLVNSFGLFRGVIVPESNLDDLLDDEPYMEFFYQFIKGVGYSVKSHSGVIAPVQRLFDGAKRSNHLNWMSQITEQFGSLEGLKKERLRLLRERFANFSAAFLVKDEGVDPKKAYKIKTFYARR